MTITAINPPSIAAAPVGYDALLLSAVLSVVVIVVLVVDDDEEVEMEEGLLCDRLGAIMDGRMGRQDGFGIFSGHFVVGCVVVAFGGGGVFVGGVILAIVVGVP